MLKYVADGVAATATELCRTRHYDAGSMTRMLKRLESKSVIRRERCTEDRRVVYLRLTKSRTDLLPQLRAAALRVISRHLAGFAAAELDMLKQYLERVIENGRPAAS